MQVSPFPFASLPRLRSVDVAALRAATSWLGAATSGALEVLGVPVRVGPAVVGARPLSATAALAWLVRDGSRALIALPGSEVRHIARRLLSLPLELGAPRPLTAAEQGVTAMACAALLAQVEAPAQVEPWQPFPDLRAALSRTERMIQDWPCISISLVLDGRGGEACVWIPPSLVVSRPLGSRARWIAPVAVVGTLVVARAPVSKEALARLAARDVIVVARAAGGLELAIGRGAIGLRAVPGADHAEVETGYARRVMEPLPDDVHVELTVTMGALSLSLRQLSELAVGQVLSLGRPLHGPFELRAGAQLLGTGELVDVDGALGVRVVSLEGA